MSNLVIILVIYFENQNGKARHLKSQILARVVQRNHLIGISAKGWLGIYYLREYQLPQIMTPMGGGIHEDNVESI